MQENNLEICETCLYYVYEVDDNNNCYSCARKLQKKNRKQMVDINIMKEYKRSFKK